MKNARRWLVLAGLTLGMSAVGAVPQANLQIEQVLSQATMEVRACQGAPQATTVTLTLQGEQPVTPIDLVLVLDRSSSEDLSVVRSTALRFISHLNPASEDRVALVSFADQARLEQGLSSDFEAVRAAVEGLSGGRLTALGDGLSLALDELAANGREGAERGIVVLSDGGATTGLDPLAQADRAGQLGLPVYFVGLSAKVSRGSLSELARRAGGKFFASAGTQSRLGVLKRLGRALLAQFIEVHEVLPDALRYAGVPAGEDEPQVRRNPNGTTELGWTLDVLVDGQVWQTRFEVTAERSGTFALNRSGEVDYLDERGARFSQPLPNPELKVEGTPPPAVRFELVPAEPKANQVVQFFDRTEAFGRTLKTWHWDFGDGEASDEQNPVHVYRDIGSYAVSLRVEDDQGCTGSAERDFRLAEFLPGPEVNIAFDPQLLRPGQTIPFSVIPLSDVVSCRWDFGDGTTSDQCQTSHRYDQAGNYTVAVAVTFADGRVLRLSRLLTVAAPSGAVATNQGTGPAVTIQIEPQAVDAQQDVKFSISTEGEGPACRWDFGDGDSAEGCEVTHRFQAAGSYTVAVAVTFADGQTRRVSQPVQVRKANAKPLADFTFDPPHPRPRGPVTFDSTTSQDEDGTVQGWVWDFGDGQTSEAQNPVHAFQRPGRFEVTLTVTDDGGAQSDPVKKTVTVGIPPGVFDNLKLSKGPDVPEWMGFYLDGGLVTDEELNDAARRFANGSYVQGTKYRLTEADLRALTELHDLRVLTQRYLDPAQAEADGYVKVGPFRPGLGQHYVNEELLNEEKPPRFDRVPVLAYAKDEEGQLELAAVSYVAFEEAEATLFGLSGWDAVTPPDLEQQIYVLNVWIWLENPQGMFAPANPEVK